jgi:hypothetical protein
MRKILIIAPLALLALAYAAWPAVSAWQLRSAVKARDLASIERKVDWPALRANLKQTVGARLADKATDAELSTFTKALLRTLGPGVADVVIDTAVTPRTLAHVLAGRLMLSEFTPEKASTTPPTDKELEEAAASDPLAPRRLRWAFFESPSRFRVEVADVKEPHRRIVSVLELQGLSWRLVDVYYRTLT